MTDVEWSPEVDEHLREAGWYPDRQVDVAGWRQELDPEGFHPHAAAVLFLTEFGGLQVPKKGRSGVDVAPVEVSYDPSLCVGQRAWFDEYATAVSGALYPLGEVGGGHASLAIDESGAVYLLFADQHRRVGLGRAAVANLIEGRRE